MVEKDTVVKEKLKFAGLTDFDEAYKFARDWFLKEDFNLVEDAYTEKAKSGGKELEIEWTASKKLTDYFKVTLKIKWRILGMSEVEVEMEGRKKKMNKIADLTLEVKGTLEKDYSNKWEGSAFNKFIKEIYNKYVIPSTTSAKEEAIQNMVQDFKDEMKAFFELTGRK